MKIFATALFAGLFCSLAGAAPSDGMCKALAENIDYALRRVAEPTETAASQGNWLLTINANIALMGQHKCEPIDFVIYPAAYATQQRECFRNAATCGSMVNKSKRGILDSKSVGPVLPQ